MTGDATRMSARALEPLARRRRAGKARSGRPGSQETCPGRNAHIALVERGGSILHRLAGLALATAAVSLAAASAAGAAPVTVDLRVEGSAATLFEGPVTTDFKDALATPSSGGPHPCNVGQNSAAPTAVRAATPTTALADSGVSWDATWNTSFVDFLVSRIGADVAGTAFWGVAVNAQFPPVGGCQVAVSPGDDVLWAFDAFVKALLALTGPAAATVGVPFAVTVRDASTGNPVAGARFSPRLIRIATSESGSGISTVKMRLTRRLGTAASPTAAGASASSASAPGAGSTSP